MGTGSVGSRVGRAGEAGDIEAANRALGPLGDFITQLAGRNSNNQTQLNRISRNLTRDALRQLQSGASIATVRRNLRTAISESR